MSADPLEPPAPSLDLLFLLQLQGTADAVAAAQPDIHPWSLALALGQFYGHYARTAGEAALEAVPEPVEVARGLTAFWQQTGALPSVDELAWTVAFHRELEGDGAFAPAVPGLPPAAAQAAPRALAPALATSADCPICLESGVDARGPHCAHRFHRACLARWLETSASCPVCRARAPP